MPTFSKEHAKVQTHRSSIFRLFTIRYRHKLRHSTTRSPAPRCDAVKSLPSQRARQQHSSRIVPTVNCHPDNSQCLYLSCLLLALIFGTLMLVFKELRPSVVSCVAEARRSVRCAPQILDACVELSRIGLLLVISLSTSKLMWLFGADTMYLVALLSQPLAVSC